LTQFGQRGGAPFPEVCAAGKVAVEVEVSVLEIFPAPVTSNILPTS
jgi:hypothetical protein